MNRKERIMKRLKEHYQILQEKGYEIVGLFLQGSQNYNLDYELSDVDSKAIVLPSLDDILLNKPMTSTTLVLDNNEHIDIKDIRVMFNTIKKQNINFVEILFTEFKIVNKEYSKLLEPIFENSERIAHMNNYAAINCMTGMALEKFKALEHPYPSTEDKIEAFGYDPKQLHHIVRMYYFMLDYIIGKPYVNCLKSHYSKQLLDIKKGTYDLTFARANAQFCVEKMKEFKDDYMKNNKLFVDKDMSDLLDSIAASVLKHYIKLCLKD